MTRDQRRAAARQLAAESRARQGLPPTVTDEATLQQIAVLFRAGDSQRKAAS